MTATIQAGLAEGPPAPTAKSRWRPAGQPAAGDSSGWGGPGERLPANRRRRRPAQALAGALVLLVCAVVGGQLALRGQPTTAVLMLARSVPAGHSLVAADLASTKLAGVEVHAFQAGSATELLGRTTLVPLPAGTLLSGALLADDSRPGAGQQVLAMALKAGAFPPSLTAGMAVSVLRVPTANAAAGGVVSVLVGRAAVVDVATDPATGVTVVSVAVDTDRVLAVAGAAAGGGISLGLLPAGG